MMLPDRYASSQSTCENHVAQVYIPATPTTRRTLKPGSAGARHRLVPHNRNPSSIDPNIGRLSGELAPFFTPRQHCGCTFTQRAALQQHPDVETPVGFDEAIERKVGTPASRPNFSRRRFEAPVITS